MRRYLSREQFTFGRRWLANGLLQEGHRIRNEHGILPFSNKRRRGRVFPFSFCCDYRERWWRAYRVDVFYRVRNDRRWPFGPNYNWLAFGGFIRVDHDLAWQGMITSVLLARGTFFFLLIPEITYGSFSFGGNRWMVLRLFRKRVGFFGFVIAFVAIPGFFSST